MKVSKFELSTPDSAGAVTPRIEFVIFNPTKEDVHRTLYDWTITDDAGYVAECSPVPEHNRTVIGPGAEARVMPMSMNALKLPSKLVGVKPKDLELSVSATLYARDFYDLGVVAVPAKEMESALASHTVSSSVIDESIKVRVFWRKMGEGDEVQLRCRLRLRNKSDVYLEKVELRNEVVDAAGAVVENRTDSVSISGRSSVGIDGGCWIRRPRLRNASVRLALSVFRPIHVAECSAVARASS